MVVVVVLLLLLQRVCCSRWSRRGVGVSELAAAGPVVARGV